MNRAIKLTFWWISRVLFTAGLIVPSAAPFAKTVRAHAAPPAAAAEDVSGYRIGAGDILQIDIWKEPESSTPSVTVRPDGNVTLCLLGELQVAGMKTPELQKLLGERYGKFIRDPRVTVFVREIHSQRVYVIGEVRREGAIRLEGPMTVLQALAESGGLTEWAKRRKIYILRMTQSGKAIIPFDYEAVVRGTKVQQNVVLQPGDTVVVPH